MERKELFDALKALGFIKYITTSNNKPVFHFIKDNIVFDISKETDDVVYTRKEEEYTLQLTIPIKNITYYFDGDDLQTIRILRTNIPELELDLYCDFK